MNRLEVRAVPFGEARKALAGIIATVREREALAPVTVVVPSNLVGLDVRRWLARRRPLANVRFLVVERLAELIAAGRLNGRGLRPRTRWQWLERLRAAAEASNGRLAELSHHPATVRRLAALATDLRGVPERVRATLLAHPDPLVAEAARVVAAAEESAAGLYDDHALVVEATRAFAEADPPTRETGLVVFYLPERLTGATADLAVAAAGAGGVVAIVGVTGDAAVDRRAAAWCELPGVRVELPPVATRLPQRLASLPDPDEEVRFAVREAWRLAGEGVPFHQMAILYGNAEQYAGLVHDRLEAGGAPYNGPGLRRLADSLAGRAVLGGLRAARGGWRRDAVIDWVTSAPLVEPAEAGTRRGPEVPGHAWDERSREAGVVRGLEQWERAPAITRAMLAEQVAEGRLGEEVLEGRVAEAERMSRFVREAARLMQAGGLRPLAAWAQITREGLDQWLPRAALERHDGKAANLPEAELAAFDEVARVLDGMAALEGDAGVGAAPVSLSTFETTLREALDVPAARRGRLGEGIFTGPVTDAAGMAFDHVFIIGMAERVLPPQPADDPLLPERVRRELDGAVPSAAERVVEARRAYLAVVAAAGTCTVTAPRVSLRDQRPAQPSRWFFEAAGALAGRAVYASDLEQMVDGREARPGWLTVVDSFEAWVREGDSFGEPAERDLAEVLRGPTPPWEHPLLGELSVADGIAAKRSRAAADGAPSGLGPWTGDVSGALLAAGDRERSATAMETLTTCPFKFFLEQELRLAEIERPEELDTIDAAMQGTLVHEVLEQFVRDVREQRGAPVVAGKWTAGERAQLLALAEEKFGEYEARGVTGRPASWQARKERLRQDLARFLDEDEAWRQLTGAAIQDVELAFGSRWGHESVAVELAPGKVVRFLGKADRVDAQEDGRLVVIDYKTGKAERFAQDPDLPLRTKRGGWLLQLPVYALAARRGEEGGAVTATYWFISEEGKFDHKKVALDAETERTFVDVLRAAEGIREAGLFPAIPGDPDWGSWKNCVFCAFDRVCPGTDRDRLWEQWKQDGRLAEFVRVVAR
jgi:RecB family exonuclease